MAEINHTEDAHAGELENVDHAHSVEAGAEAHEDAGKLEALLQAILALSPEEQKQLLLMFKAARKAEAAAHGDEAVAEAGVDGAEEVREVANDTGEHEEEVRAA